MKFSEKLRLGIPNNDPFIKSLTILGLILALLLPACAHLTISNGIPNFYRVNTNIWRGGQPNTEGWKYLSSLGVKYDIKLNTDEEASDSEAEKYGIKIIYSYIDLKHQIFEKPDKCIINAAVEFIALYSSDNGVYIHCEHGQDRTGLIVGDYRVKFNHWNKEAAYKEMLDHGFHPTLFALHRYWLEDVK